MFDPTFDGPVGSLNWEEVAGPNGGVVTRWQIKRHTGGDAYSLIATPYYRDDACFDDGTGNDPGPHLKSRSVDDGPERRTYFDLSDPTGGANGDGWKPRVCWKPSDGDPQDASVGDGRPRKFWNADIATHGLHINLIADSDNAYQTVPIDEVDSEQRMVVLPAAGRRPEPYDERHRQRRRAVRPVGGVSTPARRDALQLEEEQRRAISSW